MSLNKLLTIQQGESLPFKFDRGGESIANWSCTISWKQLPSDKVNIQALSAVIAAGGTGYVVGDVLTVLGGTGEAAQFRVDAVSGGVVTAVSPMVDLDGDYTVVPSNPASTTGGTGSGCTLTVTYNTSRTRIVPAVGEEWPGYLTNTETANLAVDTPVVGGLWWLTATLINSVTDELEQIPVRFQVTKKWA